MSGCGIKEEKREGEDRYSHHTIPMTLSYRFPFRDHVFLACWTSFMNSTVLMRPKRTSPA
jgi:hypothetical protein